MATPASAATASTPFPKLKVGSWNTDLQPWLPGGAAVIDTIAASSFDVLALQSVWTPAARDAILADPRVAAKYRYSFYPPAVQQAGRCDPILVPRIAMTNYVDGLIADGVDVRTIEQPTTTLSQRTATFGINLELISQLCYQAINNALQELAPGADPLTVVDQALASNVPNYSHGGSPGQLILSTKPLEAVTVANYNTFLTRRGEHLRHHRGHPVRVRALAAQRPRGHQPWARDAAVRRRCSTATCRTYSPRT